LYSHSGRTTGTEGLLSN